MYVDDSPVFELDPSAKKVRCRSCDAHSGECKWLGRVSAKAHLASHAHKKAVEALAERAATRKRRQDEAARASALDVALKKMPSNLVTRGLVELSGERSAHSHVRYDWQDLYLSHAGEPVVFSAGDNDTAHGGLEARDALLKKAEALLSGDHTVFEPDESPEDDDFLSNVCEILHNMGEMLIILAV